MNNVKGKYEHVKNMRHGVKCVSKRDISEALFHQNIIGYSKEKDEYILKANMFNFKDKFISLDTENHIVREALTLAYGSSIYNSHLYLLNESKSSNQKIVFRLNSDRYYDILDKSMHVPCDMNTFISANPLKFKELSKGVYNGLVELDADMRTYTVKTSVTGKSLSSIKFCNNMKFSNRNIVIRISMYAKQGQSLNNSELLEEDFRKYITELIASKNILTPNVVNFYETDCELWYCTNENSRALDWLYKLVEERLVGMSTYIMMGHRFSKDPHCRLKIAIEDMPHLFGTITPSLKRTNTFIFKQKRYDIDALARECNINIYSGITCVNTSDGTVEKIRQRDVKVKNNWNRFLWERKAVLEKLQSYEASLYSQISYEELIKLHSNLCHLYFSTVEPLYGVEKAVELTKEYCKSSIIIYDEAWLYKDIISPALNTLGKHYKYKTEQFVKKIGIPDKTVEINILNELSYSLTPAARAKRYRERKKMNEKQAYNLKIQCACNMFFRTADLERVANSFEMEPEELKEKLLEYDNTGKVRKILNREILVTKRKIYNEFRTQYFKNFVKYIYEDVKNLYDDIAIKYSVPSAYVEQVVNELEAIRDTVHIDYSTSLSNDNINCFAAIRGKSIILPAKMASAVKGFAYHLTNKAMSQIMTALNNAGKLKDNAIKIQMALAPHLRLNFAWNNSLA